MPKRGFDHQHRPPTCLSPTDWNAYPIDKCFLKKTGHLVCFIPPFWLVKLYHIKSACLCGKIHIVDY